MFNLVRNVSRLEPTRACPILDLDALLDSLRSQWPVELTRPLSQPGIYTVMSCCGSTTQGRAASARVEVLHPHVWCVPRGSVSGRCCPSPPFGKNRKELSEPHQFQCHRTVSQELQDLWVSIGASYPEAAPATQQPPEDILRSGQVPSISYLPLHFNRGTQICLVEWDTI